MANKKTVYRTNAAQKALVNRFQGQAAGKQGSVAEDSIDYGVTPLDEADSANEAVLKDRNIAGKIQSEKRS